MVAHLIEKLSPKDVTAYFFCRFDEAESLKAKTIIGSIARQFARDLPATKFRTFSQESTEGTSIISALEAMLSHSRQYFVVLDGLDECGEVQIKEVVEICHKLLCSPYLRIKLFWSSRQNVSRWLSRSFLTQQRIDLETVENQSRVAHDINTFIVVTLMEWLDGEAPELQINDPSLIGTILHCLEKEAEGMYELLYPAQQYKAYLERFLWVKFQLQALREKRSDSLILAALRDLPRNLPETFERILSKFTENDDIDLGRQIFHWVSVAKRPLTVEELREALGIRPLQEAWDDSAFINDMKKAMACCGNLVFIEEEQQTVRFTHSSVKQYLLSSAVQESFSKYHVDLTKADENAGAICVTYLNLPVFDRQVARVTGKSVNTLGITSAVIENSLPFGQSGNKLALRLLRSRNQDKKSGKSVHRLLEQAAGDTEVYRQQQNLRHYSFRPYATQFWLEHTKRRIGPESKQLWRLWRYLIWEASWRDTLSGIPWTLDDWKKRATNVIQWIVEQNHCALAQLIVGSDQRFDVDLSHANLLDLVEGAAKRGHARLIAISLDSRSIPQPILDTGLRLAAGGGHLKIVKRLLQAIADVDTTNALQVAVRGGHLDVVERLLQEKADVNAAADPHEGMTVLQAEAAGGHLDIVERLIKANADVNAAAGLYKGMTALQAAAAGGYLDIVKRLLQANADVNAAAAR